MDEISKQREFNRAVQQAMKRKSRKQMLVWMAIILLISIIVSSAIYFIQDWYDMNSQDTVNLTDIEKEYKMLEKSPGKNRVDELNKYAPLLKKLKEQ